MLVKANIKAIDKRRFDFIGAPPFGFDLGWIVPFALYGCLIIEFKYILKATPITARLWTIYG
jgi:hypothetical protein